MFAEMSPKCQKIVFGSVSTAPGSRVGPGIHRRVKHAAAPKKPREKKSHGAESREKKSHGAESRE